MIPRFLLAAATALLLTACANDAVKPEAVAGAQASTTTVELHFHAIAGLNPGANGQAAPVRVRIFELKNAATFSRSDYFALADRAQSTLGLDLLDQDEVMVQPGQQLSIQRDLDPATRQIGVLVGYRELDRAQWRTVINVPPRQSSEYQISLDVRAVRADVVVPPSSPAQ
ncbi:type VI secretion system lipoprotein TssJ [Pseudomonas synxantha]|uniref:Type VI secretion system lipoprotein TssJ n=1 Tax=Pseudomonas synxantha TaxID=47883 RepID=A0ABS0UE29_9PSED|nr:type VI secretion system lipoprotein TssJ [Pseudomonas synxantha]AZE75705.1 Type VI secretion lipoprotein/VasD [Pseudomonas synxantha]AZE81332.1 Type VI secretion lipoprotein/VasD [Pseudomonas synxantha]MBI6562592.1 type VI secretion system lipoprotein TssJ [Pseudomonas synxantha]MBI6579601.1 type VI secretion system lipoprotein TssJ [Pseudomonas synxantha]MBI6643645.1 type VI secretion system lipoprotein TssJ [Pseudomonas synxantha]